ncbi:hypothetical protein FN846DRAFT_915677 [Sphaerosporella brunnea]|uniref:Uncharacterized protein n=1 Tax=Sphaerosporella brunnea TaxID=1250544 RepID=A0A5J5FCB3_9PEZI|nr:hypothetical protein FN846DRAFT_915677 [Sphaerosporella brunnea]
MRLIAMANQWRSHQHTKASMATGLPQCGWVPLQSSRLEGESGRLRVPSPRQPRHLHRPCRSLRPTPAAPTAPATLVQTSVPGQRCSRFLNPKGVHPEPRPGRKVCDQCLLKDRGYKRKPGNTASPLPATRQPHYTCGPAAPAAPAAPAPPMAPQGSAPRRCSRYLNRTGVHRSSGLAGRFATCDSSRIGGTSANLALPPLGSPPPNASERGLLG